MLGQKNWVKKINSKKYFVKKYLGHPLHNIYVRIVFGFLSLGLYLPKQKSLLNVLAFAE